MMGSSCAVQYTVPSARSRFVKPHVELAPRQVQIGFDLSPKGETFEETQEFDTLPKLDNPIRINGNTAEERLNSTNSQNLGLIKPTSGLAATFHNRRTASTSPRSALQQLLLAPLNQSEPASSSPAANSSHSHGPLLRPACNSPRATSSAAVPESRPGLMLQGTKPCTAAIAHEPVAAADPNWIKSISGQSRCATSSKDEMKGSLTIPEPAISTIKPVAGNGARSSGMEAPMSKNQLPWTSKSERISKESSSHELSYTCKEKSIKSGLMVKEVMFGFEHPAYSHLHQKSGEVEIIGTRNEGSNERSKKSSLFVLAVSSPAAEYTNHNCLKFESNPYETSNSMDMDFLNSCHLCKRPLSQGEDIFMYSGDKAFCSMECRYQQILTDERNKRHAPPIIRSGASPVFKHYTTATADDAAATTTAHHPIMINRTNFMNPAAAA